MASSANDRSNPKTRLREFLSGESPLTALMIDRQKVIEIDKPKDGKYTHDEIKDRILTSQYLVYDIGVGKTVVIAAPEGKHQYQFPKNNLASEKFKADFCGIVLVMHSDLLQEKLVKTMTFTRTRMLLEKEAAERKRKKKERKKQKALKSQKKQKVLEEEFNPETFKKDLEMNGYMSTSVDTPEEFYDNATRDVDSLLRKQDEEQDVQAAKATEARLKKKAIFDKYVDDEVDVDSDVDVSSDEHGSDSEEEDCNDRERVHPKAMKNNVPQDIDLSNIGLSLRKQVIAQITETFNGFGCTVINKKFARRIEPLVVTDALLDRISVTYGAEGTVSRLSFKDTKQTRTCEVQVKKVCRTSAERIDVQCWVVCGEPMDTENVHMLLEVSSDADLKVANSHVKEAYSRCQPGTPDIHLLALIIADAERACEGLIEKLLIMIKKGIKENSGSLSEPPVPTKHK